MTALRVCACVFTFVGVATPASADWHVTPFIGVTVGGSTTFFSPEDEDTGREFGTAHRVLGASVSRVTGAALGLEALVIHVPGIFDRKESGRLLVISSRSTALMGNVIVSIPRKWNAYGLRPFVSGGLGLLNVSQTQLLDALSFRRNVLGYNVGGGATGPLSERTGIRFDARYVSYLKSGEAVGFSIDAERLSYWTLSVGYMIRLGPQQP